MQILRLFRCAGVGYGCSPKAKRAWSEVQTLSRTTILNCYSEMTTWRTRRAPTILTVGDFVGPANVAYCHQRTYGVTFRTSRLC